MKTVFCIFQGGGAQGISHVGAFSAIRELDIQIAGVAGTSAGALIAALIAVGCEPGDIIEPTSAQTSEQRDILSRHGMSPIDLLGRKEWRKFKFLLHLSQFPLLYFMVLVFGYLSLFGLLVGQVQGSSGTWDAGLLCVLVALACLALLLTLSIFIYLIRPIIRDKGIFDPERVEAAIEQILRHEVKRHLDRFTDEDRRRLGADFSGLPHNRKLSFRDIDPRRFRALDNPPPFVEVKIATTDLTDGKLQLFGHDHHPDASMAEVVAASISIPLIFKPARIKSVTAYKDHIFVDGGLLANLPVWAFKEEKKYHERRLNPHQTVPNIAFELRDALSHGEAASGWFASLLRSLWRDGVVGGLRWAWFGRRDIGFLGHTKRVLRTGIFGGQAITHNFVSDLTSVKIESPVALLAFDVSWLKARDAYQAGLLQSYRAILRQVQAGQKVQQLLAELHDIALRAVQSSGVAHDEGLRLRLLVFMRVGRSCFKVVHSHNLHDDTDDQIVIDVDCKGVPQAHDQRLPVSLRRSAHLHTLAQREKIPMSKYDLANLWRDWESTVCYPLISSNDRETLRMPLQERPVAVLSIDSNRDISEALMSDFSVQSIVSHAAGLVPLLPSSLENL